MVVWLRRGRRRRSAAALVSRPGEVSREREERNRQPQPLQQLLHEAKRHRRRLSLHVSLWRRAIAAPPFVRATRIRQSLSPDGAGDDDGAAVVRPSAGP